MAIDPRFSMTVDQLLDGIREQAFVARRSKGRKRREAFCRVDDFVRTARDYVILGFPEPKPADPSPEEAERHRVFEEMREIDNAIEAGSTGTGNQTDGGQ